MSEWRESADPDELAAAVAAGVRVMGTDCGVRWWGTSLAAAKDFNHALNRGTRYRVPADWTWQREPEWRETQDPDELAAAVAAGVEVQRSWDGTNWSPTVCWTAGDFRYAVNFGARYRVPASWIYTNRQSPVDRVWQSPRADAVQLLRDLQDAACSVMARPDVLGMLHGQTRHALSDLIVDLALALDSQAVMS